VKIYAARETPAAAVGKYILKQIKNCAEPPDSTRKENKEPN
jgi:hypothetical protein